MSDELKLCPWCDGCGEIVDAGEPFVAQAQCQSCGRGVVGEFGNIEDAIIAWNSLPRAPRWAEYNGTEITLPPVGKMVLVSAKAGWRDYDKCRDRGEMMEWRCQGLPLEIGDRWMPWPEGVE